MQGPTEMSTIPATVIIWSQSSAIPIKQRWKNSILADSSCYSACNTHFTMSNPLNQPVTDVYVYVIYEQALTEICVLSTVVQLLQVWSVSLWDVAKIKRFCCTTTPRECILDRDHKSPLLCKSLLMCFFGIFILECHSPEFWCNIGLNKSCQMKWTG